jgi:SMODS domain-containing protein
LSVNSAFEDFRQALEIDKQTIEAAIDLHETARAGLKKRLEGHVRSFLSGSYPRNTRLDPLNDLDTIVVVESTEPWDDDPETAMSAAGDAVRPDFPGCTIRLGAHAAKLTPKDPPIEDVHIDIVVGRHVGPGTILEISERLPGPTWRKSGPEAHATALSDANVAWAKRLVALVKMIKHWNRSASGKALPSFLVEALVMRIFTASGDEGYSAMTKRFFVAAKDAILTPTSSPAVPDGYVDGHMNWSEREAHSDRLRKASRIAPAS